MATWTRAKGWWREAKLRVPTEAHQALLRYRQQRAEGTVQVGVGTYGVPTVHVWRDDEGRNVGGRILIGNYVSIAGDVELFTGGNHLPQRVTTFPVRQIYGLAAHGEDEHPGTRGDVVIGSDVWLAQGCAVLSGVTVGHGAVVGARAVVSRDVRPYAIVVGNPATEVGRRFSDDVVEELLRLAWWDRDEQWVAEHADLLCAVPNISALRAVLSRDA
ncbi:MAG: CatB-related O-acetyltransferase [Planctomycetes bacterium]|nr:CatB-related O-acetyltransferase [Planctomycetota bacterium]